MDLLRNFFKIDNDYKNAASKYKPTDGILAIAVYATVMVLYAFAGMIYASRKLYLGHIINFLLIAICIACVLLRRQPLKSIGFGRKNLFKSFALGFAAAAVLLTVQIIIGVTNGGRINGVEKLASNFLYYFFVIALAEETVFRGFIQTRIYGIIKNPVAAVIVVAFMFMSIHIPFQMCKMNMSLINFIENNCITLICTFLWHIVFNFLYSKYNSIAASTVFHSIMDWSNILFIG